MKKVELLLLPLLTYIFFITYHYFEFYQNDYENIFRFIPFTFSKNQYEKIQSYHPYYPIYNEIRKAKYEKRDVVYVQTIREPKNKVFLRELTIMIDYFNYPEKILTIDMKKLKKIELRPHTIVISDTDLQYPKEIRDDLILIKFFPPELVRINRRMEKQEIFYIYKSI